MIKLIHFYSIINIKYYFYFPIQTILLINLIRHILYLVNMFMGK
jgi:hypothetical protein